MSVSPDLGVLPSPVVDGSSVTYPSVRPSVDLRLTATPTGVNQLLIVHDATGLTSLGSNVAFEVAGARLSRLDTGTTPDASALASNGLISPSAAWWDSRIPGSDATGPGGMGLPRALPDLVSPSALTISPQGIGGDPGLTYPVYIDPSWTHGQTGRDFIDSLYPDQEYWNGAASSDGLQHVGFISSAYAGDGNHTTRSFWQFSTSGLPGTLVVNATFSTTMSYAFECPGLEIDLWRSDAISSGTNWTNRPALQTLQSRKGGSYGWTHCGTGSNGFDAKNAAQWAADNNASSVTLGLKALTESSSSSWKKFAGAASLIVEYDHDPSVPTLAAPVGCPFVCTSPSAVVSSDLLTTVKLPITVNDTDGSAGGTLTAHPTLEQYKGSPAAWSAIKTASIGSLSPGATAQWDVGKLAEGTYRYKAYAVDTDGAIGPTSGYFQFAVDNTDPATPTVNATPPNPVTVGVTDIPVSVSSASTDAYGYVYATSPSGVAPVFPATAACTVTVSGFLTKCGTGASSTVLHALSESTVFSVEVFDKAGNRDVGTSASTPASVTISGAARDYAAAGAGHSWPATALSPNGSCLTPATIDDSKTVGPVPVTVQAAACVQDASSTPPKWLAGGSAHDITFPALTTSASAKATGPVVDTTKNFTAGAWIKTPGFTATTGTGYSTALSIAPGTPWTSASNSSLYLQMWGNATAAGWRACLRDQGGSNQIGCTDYTAASAPSVVPNEWVFLAVTWDATDNVMVLYMSTANGTIATPPTPVRMGSYPNTGTAATGPLTVGQAVSTGAVSNQFSGEVLEPFAIPGVMSQQQMTWLWQHQTPATVATNQ